MTVVLQSPNTMRPSGARLHKFDSTASTNIMPPCVAIRTPFAPNRLRRSLIHPESSQVAKPVKEMASTHRPILSEGTASENNENHFRLQPMMSVDADTEQMWTLKRANPITEDDDEISESPTKRSRSATLSWQDALDLDEAIELHL